MSDIMDYLAWRGDLTFEQAPFNEVDNLILSQLAYVNFDGIVPGIHYEETVPLHKVCDLFYRIHTEREILEDKTFVRKAPLMMKEMAKTPRFRNIMLGKYVSKLDYTEEKQFSAIHYYLDEDTMYVGYRGTDDTIVGWKEDFNMSFMMPVPSQIEAVTYLDMTMNNPRNKLYIGGHSKGGNLAIYAAVHCRQDLKDKIVQVYNNDGPGFNEQMLQNPDYQAMLPRITTIVPQSSIIGMLLEHEEDYMVIKSKQLGFMQHDAMSWEVIGPRFVYCEDLSKGSQILDYSIKSWVDHLSPQQREFFIDALYSILEATGAKTLTDLSNFKLKKLSMLLKSYNAMDEATKDMLFQTVKKLTVSYYHVFKDSMLNKSQKTLAAERNLFSRTSQPHTK